ncbi:MAG: ECF transporter S component [Lachnospiraceae bacterium]|nr:ECF transporter S component [Lachnospiraceae bacterium]
MSDFTQTNPSGTMRGTRMGKQVRYMTATGLLSAVAFILQFFEFSVPLMPSFIKMDLSDLPELIGAFALGPFAGAMIALIKNLIHLPLSQTGGVGELCNFLLGACFAVTAGTIYKLHKTKTGAIAASLIGAVCMAVLSFPINLFITYPFYELMMPREAIVAAYQVILPRVQTLAECLLIFNVPFTFVKAMLSVGITMVVYKRLSPILHG